MANGLLWASPRARIGNIPKQRELQIDVAIDPNGEALQALKLALGDQNTIQNATKKLQKWVRRAIRCWHT